MTGAIRHHSMVDLATARQLLDFGKRMGQGPRAEEQLEGAVAMHNILEREGVAYLADEVGMGKTYVALGVMALFRHFNPKFRVLVIAPRANIQEKWRKELQNFVAHNIRFTDFRNRALDGFPARPEADCQNLLDLVRQAAVNPHRDFFARLTSFSLGVSEQQDRESWRRLRDELCTIVPWLDPKSLPLRGSKEAFKDNIARALCCALPVFDLVIVDEGHNLKHGFRTGVAARNRVLALAFGHPSESARRREFPGYGSRARRVLFLSATPLEESYHQLWNQLDVFGKGAHFTELIARDASEERQKEVAERILVRRVTAITMGGAVHTKNQYRREWRSGGVRTHDEPLQVDDPRQRLTVALVQKKVAELLGSERFNMAFQIGMLASFESFLETARLKRGPASEDQTFDDAEQTDEPLEREGIDVQDLNNLARNHRARFRAEMPHPKMDALVDALSGTWRDGRKALVFVRRVASVREIKRRLDDAYDAWLLEHLRQRLPREVLARFEGLVRQYQGLRADAGERRDVAVADSETGATRRRPEADHGGLDTFFAWFFRGEGPPRVVSGANIQRRFTQQGSSYATFFEDNHVAALLGAQPGDVTRRLAEVLGIGEPETRDAVRREAAKYLSRARKPPRAARIEAVQAAALDLLRDSDGPIGKHARLVWHELFEERRQPVHSSQAPPVNDELEFQSFFTELRDKRWKDLRVAVWPESREGDFRQKFRETYLRGQALASLVRLGHSLIDMYVVTIRRLGSLELRRLDRETAGDVAAPPPAVRDFLELLEHQRLQALATREWGAFDELSHLAANLDLVLDVNVPQARTVALREVARELGRILGRQQPTAGMSGQVNRTVVKQFRMPGYPFVLVTTDLLQEGEDLHTFCSAVYHYGISWTPSSMEQRIGRVDRVRSQTDRRLNGASEAGSGDELLQVFYPFLPDTVEVLQVRKVLRRMNRFLRLMHEGLAAPPREQRKIFVDRELAGAFEAVEAITTRLTTAFPVTPEMLMGATRELAVGPDAVAVAQDRLSRLAESAVCSHPVEWERQVDALRLLGSVQLPSGRVQPFALLLGSDGRLPLVRCVSPVGLVDEGILTDHVKHIMREATVHAGVVPAREGEMKYNLTIEDDVWLAATKYDGHRVGLLIDRVTTKADEVESALLDGADHRLSELQPDIQQEGAREAR